MTNSLLEKEILVEVDFQNNFILDQGRSNLVDGRNPKKRKLNLELKAKYLETVDSFWHTDKDELSVFQYYSDGTYWCQRRKKKHDFATESTYWNDYRFTGASPAQVRQMYESLATLREVQKEVKKLEIEELIKEIDHEAIFYEQRFYKLRRMRESILNSTDFRVLPDVSESFDGERDMWIAWRSWVREKTLMHPSDPLFHDETGKPSGLKFFKYAYEFKFPVDPKYYYRIYPDGKLDDGTTDAPPFMDPTDSDQWVRQEVEASSDFYRQNEQNIYNLSGRGIPNQRFIKDSVLELMKELAVDDIIPVDWDKYFTDISQITE